MRNKKFLFFIIVFICLLAFFHPILTSSYPDGLERTAEDLGFDSKAEESFSVFGDYNLPIGNSFISSALAGVLGVGLTYLFIVGLGKLLGSRKAA